MLGRNQKLVVEVQAPQCLRTRRQDWPWAYAAEFRRERAAIVGQLAQPWLGGRSMGRAGGVFRVISKSRITTIRERSSSLTRSLRLPQWTNSGLILRELLAH